jgi:hypothetical protein
MANEGEVKEQFTATMDGCNVADGTINRVHAESECGVWGGER